MSSAHPNSHLSAGPGQEVVYCHSCTNEWLRGHADTAYLACPICSSDAVEIVSEDNDPRDFHASDSLFDHQHNDYGDDSDPAEDDIEEQDFFGPNNTYAHRTSTNYQPRQNPSSPLGGFSRTSRRRNPPDATDPTAVMNTFSEFLNGFTTGQSGRSGPETLFGSNTNHNPNRDPNPNTGPHVHRHVFTFGGRDVPVTNVRHRTFNHNLHGGTASFTIATGPIRTTGSPAIGDFNTVFSNIMGAMGSPPSNDEQQRQPPLPTGFPAALHQILAAVLSRDGLMAGGDAVHSDEALDRIITALMENNNAHSGAPPASENAIDRLGRKVVNDDMLGSEGRAECTICLSEVSLGQEVVALPCNHWFHDECVIMWLRQHNTCPVCRSPVEAAEQGAGRHSSASASASAGAGAGAGAGASAGASATNANTNANNNIPRAHIHIFRPTFTPMAAASAARSSDSNNSNADSASARRRRNSNDSSVPGLSPTVSDPQNIPFHTDSVLNQNSPHITPRHRMQNPQERFAAIREVAGVPASYYRSRRDQERSGSERERRRRDSHSPNPGPPFSSRRYNNNSNDSLGGNTNSGSGSGSGSAIGQSYGTDDEQAWSTSDYFSSGGNGNTSSRYPWSFLSEASLQQQQQQQQQQHHSHHHPSSSHTSSSRDRTRDRDREWSDRNRDRDRERDSARSSRSSSIQMPPGINPRPSSAFNLPGTYFSYHRSPGGNSDSEYSSLRGAGASGNNGGGGSGSGAAAGGSGSGSSGGGLFNFIRGLTRDSGSSPSNTRRRS